MPVRLIRMFPDWGHYWPLWEDGGQNYALTPTDLNLSRSLASGLEAWMKLWRTSFSPERGWSRSADEERWTAQGRDLSVALAAELMPAARVSFEWQSCAR